MLSTSSFAEHGIDSLFIDTLYEDITFALSVADAALVPSHKMYSRKFWWNSEMNDLKNDAHFGHHFFVHLCD